MLHGSAAIPDDSSRQEVHDEGDGGKFSDIMRGVFTVVSILAVAEHLRTFAHRMGYTAKMSGNVVKDLPEGADPLLETLPPKRKEHPTSVLGATSNDRKADRPVPGEAIEAIEAIEATEYHDAKTVAKPAAKAVQWTERIRLLEDSATVEITAEKGAPEEQVEAQRQRALEAIDFCQLQPDEGWIVVRGPEAAAAAGLANERDKTDQEVDGS